MEVNARDEGYIQGHTGDPQGAEGVLHGQELQEDSGLKEGRSITSQNLASQVFDKNDFSMIRKS